MFKEIINKTENHLALMRAEHLLSHLLDLNSENEEVEYISMIVYEDLIAFHAETKCYSLLNHYPRLVLQDEQIIKGKKDLFRKRKCYYNIPNTDLLRENIGTSIRNLNKSFISWENIHIQSVKHEEFKG